MGSFSKLLLALDIGAESDLLLIRASQLCEQELEKLYVVHVVKQGMHDLDQLNSNHCNALHAQREDDHLAIKIRETLRRKGLMIDSDHILLARGEPASEIKRLAKEIEADLVIVGSRCKQNDWVSLPGATTNCVLQGATADVIAVKV